MTNDTLKTAFTYSIALVIIVGGGVLLLVPSQVSPEQLLPFLTGIVGTVIGYVFGERTTTSATQNFARLTGAPVDDIGPSTNG